MFEKLVGGIFLLVIVFLLIAIGPLLIIWSWNELFGALHAIPYTLSTWVATLLLVGALRTSVKVKKD